VGHEIKHDGYRLIANRGSGRVLMCSISSLNGREQRTLPLENRKARPEGLMRGSPTRIQYSDHVDGDARRPFLEGRPVSIKHAPLSSANRSKVHAKPSSMRLD
jgi:ATP-dependent DNA ligase